MGVAAQYGVISHLICENSVDRFTFIDFLEKIKDRVKEEKITIFMDNLAVHKTAIVRDTMTDMGFNWIYNCPYSPNDNPIEQIFG